MKYKLNLPAFTKKHNIKTILFYLLCGIVFFYSFTKEKTYSMKFNQGEIITIMKVINESNAPHLQVKQAQEIMSRELSQYVDSTGKLK